MIRFSKGEMKRKLEETMVFLQAVETQQMQATHDKKVQKEEKNA